MGSSMCVAVMFCFKGTKRVRGFGLFQSITNIVSAFGPALGGTYEDLNSLYNVSGLPRRQVMRIE